MGAVQEAWAGRMLHMAQRVEKAARECLMQKRQAAEAVSAAERRRSELRQFEADLAAQLEQQLLQEKRLLAMAAPLQDVCHSLYQESELRQTVGRQVEQTRHLLVLGQNLEQRASMLASNNSKRGMGAGPGWVLQLQEAECRAVLALGMHADLLASLAPVRCTTQPSPPKRPSMRTLPPEEVSSLTPSRAPHPSWQTSPHLQLSDAESEDLLPRWPFSRQRQVEQMLLEAGRRRGPRSSPSVPRPSIRPQPPKTRAVSARVTAKPKPRLQASSAAPLHGPRTQAPLNPENDLSLQRLATLPDEYFLPQTPRLEMPAAQPQSNAATYLQLAERLHNRCPVAATHAKNLARLAGQ
eukprot:NODE_1331_length_1191_cov_94.696147_g1095_i0.p1 GENE.NODE_1331_length_1191_cov_94.696147_g1095_i0~~NODE_1331_length_1191_cov_94.696147_g1095_i0.p1  ORF type:complete len:360 (-),score=81.86 NODE_1331_length_1191_cov_94.696147_g1095_i0:112-1170(-)